MGGALEAFYSAFDETNACVIAEAPDNVSVAALAPTVNATGCQLHPWLLDVTAALRHEVGGEVSAPDDGFARRGGIAVRAGRQSAAQHRHEPDALRIAPCEAEPDRWAGAPGLRAPHPCCTPVGFCRGWGATTRSEPTGGALATHRRGSSECKHSN